MASSVLVTGAAGFIGYHAADRLLRSGAPVVGLDDLSPYYDVGLKQARLERLRAHPAFSFVKCDIADRAALNRAFAEFTPRRVLHLAAQAGVRHSISHPEDYIPANLVGFFNILEACRAANIEHLAYASSSSVYGANTRLPLSADRPADHPVSLYAATKRANELMAHSYSHLHGLPTTGLRLFTVYGPWGRPDMAPSIFAKAILTGEPIKLFNRGNMRRDFTYVDEAVDGVLALLARVPAADPHWSGDETPLASSTAPWRLYNIGGSRSEEIMQVIEILERIIGRHAILEYLPMQPGEVVATYADVSPLAAEIGFQPQLPLEEGLRRFVAWFRHYHRL